MSLDSLAKFGYLSYFAIFVPVKPVCIKYNYNKYKS